MSDKKTYTVINVLSENVVLSIEENMSSEDALTRYFELKEFGDSIDTPKSLIFIIEGSVVKQNIKTKR